MEETPKIVHLSSGNLQDLWNAIRDACVAPHATTIDLEGGHFSGRVNGLKISVCAGTKTMYDKAFDLATVHPVTIQNGTIDLGSYSLLVSAGLCCLKNVVLKGEGQDWRRRVSTFLVYITGRLSRLRMEGSTLHCSSPAPVHTMLMDRGAQVYISNCKMSHSNQAMGIKMVGGTLEAFGSEFEGHHEIMSILTPAPSSTAAGAKATGEGEERSMVKLSGCTLSGVKAGSIGTVCTVMGSRSSLSAERCQIGHSAVVAIVSRGAWLVLEDCSIADSTIGGLWCSGGHAQATNCQFVSHPQPAVRIERKGSIELRCCTFTAPQSTGGYNTVGLSIDGAGAFARSVDCKYEGYGLSAIVESAGGSFLLEEGVEEAIQLN